MRARHLPCEVLLGAAILSLPLCLVSLLVALMTFVPLPMWRGEFTVVNASEQTLYVTPIARWRGQERHVMDQYVPILPNAPALGQADLRLGPGQSRHVVCIADEDVTLSEIAVRNPAGEYRQLPVMEQPTLLMGEFFKAPTYTIDSFDALPGISFEVNQVVGSAPRYNLKIWVEILGLMSLGLIPLGLFGVRRRLAERSPS
jgi:hypothetical protein